MVQKGLVSEMITGVWRIKWYKYRWPLLAALILNVLLLNQFVFEVPLNPFGALLNINDFDFNGPYVGWPLARACNETAYQPGLIFVCDNNSGGIGNIRNFILTCIRYAIDAGASGIILPKIQRRSEEDLGNIFTAGMQPFDYFFDEDHFRYAMETYCPQMTIYDEVDHIPNKEKKREKREFYPKDLNVDLDGCDGRGVNRHLDMFRTKFDGWLKQQNCIPSVEEPVTVRFKWATFFEWPIYRDGPEFAATFGDLLRIRKDVQELAAKTIVEMSKFAGVEPDPTYETLNTPYLGIHLRTESDALGFWPNYETQTKGYMEAAEKNNLKHAYLACGSPADSHKFAEEAHAKLGMNMTTKLDLLKGDDLKRLTDLSWDQQALVDFLVLQKSTHFTGCSFSSFTMNIAIKRHLMTGGVGTRAWKSPADDYSTLIGRFESWYGDWMFMYECMWP
ncbi:uncharacterized protein LY89DRAFT_698321 [Mollisia scopiformis]|uniref:O-fucosyltransferase family protein n=1 Tax=Mollisia scopiformis TaxID=149040 RepID=A0A194X3M7_MOLSC|nr:uncharacterized protein LY89DRAFT_698321 [Mollisia scopiformis]KUJ14634.1 hypothetical protein LY89DRAFT_698321 [Mollisia scopiformis]